MVTVLFFTEFDTSDNPSRVCAQFDQSPDAINKFSRKFIVLNDDSKSISTDFALVIGPVWHEEYRKYYHSHLKDAVLAKLGVLGLGKKVNGGGMMTFTSHQTAPMGPFVWRATMHGKSSQFGPYDPRMLLPENRKCIVDSLQMAVSFEWACHESLQKK